MAFSLAALIVVALDQVSKFFIRANMNLGESIPEEGFFRITYGTNTGGVFGLFANQAFLITLTAIVGVAAILVYSRYPQANRVLVRVALGLLLGGAVGNLIDRIRFGEVVDFIDVGAWPVFNVADSAVVVGVILIIYHFLFGQKRGVGARR
ncbi:MAG: signal peptidase II [Dehalococcoidia bacterium]|nr:signal peptidase II [Dehalococcoidia bacterium]